MRRLLFIAVILSVAYYGYSKFYKKSEKTEVKTDQELVDTSNSIKKSIAKYPFNEYEGLLQNKVLEYTQNPELAEQIISFSKESDVDALIVTAIISRLSKYNSNFNNFGSGLLGITQRHIKIAKKKKEEISVETDPFDPNQNLAIGTIALNSIFSEDYQKLNDFISDYLSTEDELAQDIISDENQKLTVEIVSAFEELVALKPGEKKQEDSELNKFTASLSDMGIKITYSEELYNLIKAELPKEFSQNIFIRLIKEISNFEKNKVIGDKSGLLQLTSKDAESYGFFASELLNPISNVKIGISKIKDIINAGIKDEDSIIAAFLIGIDQFKETKASNGALNPEIISIVNKVTGKIIEQEILPTSTPNVINVNYINKIIQYGLSETEANNLATLIIRKSEEYQFPINFIFSLVETESSFNKDIISKSNKVGLLQINQDKSQELIQLLSKPAGDLKDPEYNLDLGLAALKYYFNIFLEKKELALAAYQIGANELYLLLENKSELPLDIKKYIDKVLSIENKLNELDLTKDNNPVIQKQEESIATPVVTSELTPEPTINIIKDAPVVEDKQSPTLSPSVELKVVETPEEPSPSIELEVLATPVQIKKYRDTTELIKALVFDETKRNLNEDLIGKIVRESKLKEINPLLFVALINNISNFDISFSDDKNEKYSIFKLDDSRASKIANYSGMTYGGVSSLKDVNYNIRLASKFIYNLYQEFPNDDEKVLTSFFWGPGNVRAGKEPKPEIKKQVSNILEKYKNYKINYKLVNE